MNAAEAEKVFRPTYRELTAEEKQDVASIKEVAGLMLSAIDSGTRDVRAACIARTRLEEVVMWAVKGITG